MTLTEKQQGIADAGIARAELYSTLGQLKDRLNYAQRVDNALDDARLRIAEQKQRNPLAFVGGVAGVAVIAGVAVWGVASSVARRFR